MHIKDWQKAVIQFENILRHKYDSNENHNIHSDECYAEADIVLKYKELLTDFMADYDMCANTPISKVKTYDSSFIPSYLALLELSNPNRRYKKQGSVISADIYIKYSTIIAQSFLFVKIKKQIIFVS